MFKKGGVFVYESLCNLLLIRQMRTQRLATVGNGCKGIFYILV